MDDNGMIILHKDFIEKPPDNQEKLANQHVAIKVRYKPSTLVLHLLN